MYQDFKDLNDCSTYLFSFIHSDKLKTKSGGNPLSRELYILKKLRNPQNKLKIIHIAGTSGKGSTATYISSLLVKHGFNVSLTVSPHLVDIRERLQINNIPISEEKFIFYLGCIKKVVDRYVRDFGESPKYAEMIMILFFYASYKEKVDYAVVETGMGGIIDASNVCSLESKTSVITRIGLDHTRVLGKTYAQIAAKKAGIINKNSDVFTIEQKKSVLDVFKHEVMVKNSRLSIVSVKSAIRNVRNFVNYQIVDLQLPGVYLGALRINTPAIYQIENILLSFRVFLFLSQRDDFEFDEEKMREVFVSTRFEGRLSIRQFTYRGKRKVIIADGAHNPQKISALLKSLKYIPIDKKIAFVMGFKKGKDSEQMIQRVAKFASKIYLTGFTLDGIEQNISQEEEVLKQVLSKVGIDDVLICNNVRTALTNAFKSYDCVVVTGSLYLLSDLYANTKYFNTVYSI
jgi:dihydrofolate synthase/folylpolyglutamate synthase